MESKVKPRFDGKGSEFGLIHRDLPPSYTMFDIDYLEAEAKIKLTASKEDYSFIEYRTDFNSASINFIALFELKYKGSKTVKNQIENRKVGTPIFAQMQMCKQLNMRYIYVVATNGSYPYYFVEIFTNNKGYKNLGTLKKNDDMLRFWNDKLNIKK